MQMSLAINKKYSGFLAVDTVCDQAAGNDYSVVGLLRFPSSIRSFHSEYIWRHH